MISSLISALFGCQHTRLTFPMSQRRRGRLHQFSAKPKPYVTCLDCGAEFEYSWDRMRVGARREPVVRQEDRVGLVVDRSEL